MTYVVMQFAPAALDREMAASYCGLSQTTFEKAVREKKAPQPRQLAGRRVAWLHACPVSDQLPPQNTGEKKPRAGAKN